MNDLFEGARLGAIIAIGLAAWSIAGNLIDLNLKLDEIVEILKTESR